MDVPDADAGLLDFFKVDSSLCMYVCGCKSVGDCRVQNLKASKEIWGT